MEREPTIGDFRDQLPIPPEINGAQPASEPGGGIHPDQLPLTPRQPIPREEEPVERPWYEYMSAGMERENYLSRWSADYVASLINPDKEFFEPTFEFDANYLFEEDKKNTGYPPSIMYKARSAQHAEFMRQQLNREFEDLKLINESGWGTFGSVVGTVGRPENMLSLAIATRSVLGAVAAEVALESGSEAMLHAQQLARTKQESLLNVAMTGVAVGILGKASQMLARRYEIPKAQPDVSRSVDGATDATYSPGGSGGAARVGETTKEAETMAGSTTFSLPFSDIEYTIPSVMDIPIWLPQRWGGTRSLGERLAIGPGARLMQAQVTEVRQLYQEFANNTFYTKGMAEGKSYGPSVEAMAEAANGRAVDTIVSINNDLRGKAIELDPSLGTRGVQKGIFSKSFWTNEDPFDIAVGQALANGDRHTNPFVQEAAQRYRKEVLTPMLEEAINTGLLPPIMNKADTVAAWEKVADEWAANPISDFGNVARMRDKLTVQKELQRSENQLKNMEKKPTAPKKQQKRAEVEARVADLKAELEEALPLKELNQLRKAAKEADEMQAQRVAETAEWQRRIDEAPDNYAKFAETYFPRVYNKQAIFADWDKLKKMLTEDFALNVGDKLDAAEVEALVIDTMANMVGGMPVNAVRGGGGKPGFIKQRALDLAESKLDAYLDRRASAVMLRYTDGMNPYLEMRKHFGEDGFASRLDDINTQYKYKIDKAPNQAARNRLERERADVQKDFELVRDRILGDVQSSSDPSNLLVRAIQGVKLFNMTTQLGGVVLSSVPDLARPLMQYGFRSWAKGLAKSARQLTKSLDGKRDAAQIRRTGAAIQRTLNERAQQLTDSMETGSKLQQQTQKAWGNVTLFNHWTDMAETIAGHTAMDWVLRQGAKQAQGKVLGAGVNAKLARMGFSSEELARIYQQSSKSGGTKDPDLLYANTLEWDDFELAKRFEAGIGSDVKNSIIRLSAGDKPRFMDDATWSMLLQYWSFAMGATNKMLVAGFQQTDRQFAEGLSGMLFLGSMVGIYKSMLAGQETDDWDDSQYLYEAIDRSGITGVYRQPFSVLWNELSRQGLVTGKPSRYVGREIEGVLGGATVSQLGRAFRTYDAAMEGDFDKAGENAMKLLPFISNTLHFRQIMERLGDM